MGRQFVPSPRQGMQYQAYAHDLAIKKSIEKYRTSHPKNCLHLMAFFIPFILSFHDLGIPFLDRISGCLIIYMFCLPFFLWEFYTAKKRLNELGIDIETIWYLKLETWVHFGEGVRRVDNWFRGESKGVPITAFDSSCPYTWACYGPYTSLPLWRPHCNSFRINQQH